MDTAKARWAALLAAATGGDEATVRAVLAEDTTATSVKDAHGWTPLMRAAAGGHKSVVNLLLTAPTPASTSSKNKFGKTALHYACGGGHGVIARVLLMYSADPRAKDAAGSTPFDDALASGHRGLVEDLCAKTPGVSLPPPCEPPVLFKADASSLTLCWEAVVVVGEEGAGAGARTHPPTPEVAAALAVTGYRVQLAVAGGGEGLASATKWTLLASDVPPGTCTYKVRGLGAGRSYVTRVAAGNAYGYGPWSDGSDVMTTAVAGAGVEGGEGEGEHGGAAPTPAAPGMGSPIMFWGSKSRTAVPLVATPVQGGPADAPLSGRRGGRSLSRGHASSSSSKLDESAYVGERERGLIDPRLPPRGDAPSTPTGPRGGGGGGGGRGGGGGGGGDIEEMRAVLRTLQLDLEEETHKRRTAEEEVGAFTASPAALSRLSLDGLSSLEGRLEASLRAVRGAKEAKMKEAIGEETSRALCVVCLSRQKNMLFLPCKHLCACSECAGRIMRPTPSSDPLAAARTLEPQCPICRRAVQQVLDVYA